MRQAVILAALVLMLSLGVADASPSLEVGQKAWAFEVRVDGGFILVGAWTRESCDKALRDSHTVENPHIQAIGSCFAVRFMDEQVGLEVWMVETPADTFILFSSRKACETLTAEVHEHVADRPSCSRVWVRTVV